MEGRMNKNVVPLESEIESAVVKYAKNSGWRVFKLNLMGNRGWPDRLFIRNGPLFLFIEFKRPGIKPTKLQDFRLDQLRAMGVVAIWSSSKEECYEFLDTAAETPVGPTPVPGEGD